MVAHHSATNASAPMMSKPMHMVIVLMLPPLRFTPFSGVLQN
jgi:hypothetical protein